jgi:hypothetical protein
MHSRFYLNIKYHLQERWAHCVRHVISSDKIGIQRIIGPKILSVKIVQILIVSNIS